MADEDEVDVIGDFSLESIEVIDAPQYSIRSINDTPDPTGKYTHTIQSRNLSQISAEGDSKDHLNLPKVLLESNGHEVTVPNYIHEEVLTECGVRESIPDVISLMRTGQPTVSACAIYKPSSLSREALGNAVTKSKHSLLKPEVLSDIGKSKSNKVNVGDVDGELIMYADDFDIGSTESVGGSDNSDTEDEITNTDTLRPHIMPKAEKKPGNHRRKVALSSGSSGSKGPPKTKFNISVLMKNKHRSKRYNSPSRIRYKNESIETAASPKLQLVFSSGQALPVSEGEQVIKIEKKKSADSESDIDIDIDSDDNNESVAPTVNKTEHVITSNNKVDRKTEVVQRKFEPVRRRQKTVNLDGDGGCTIMHTESGDLIEVLPEPRKEKVPKKQPINLLACKLYNTDKPAPYSVRLLVSALVLMDAHAHGSRAEVMGLLGGELRAGVLHLRGYRPCAAAASHTHCDMCPVSQARAAEALNSAGHAVVGWHHSHPRFTAQPSEQDLRTQQAMQLALERPHVPFLALITSQHWARGRTASTYRCFRVEWEDGGRQQGYQFSVKLVPDLTAQAVPEFLRRLRDVASAAAADVAHRVRLAGDVCADANLTYLEKCLSSISHHLTSAGYSEQDLTYKHIMRGVRDVFR